MNLMPLFLFLLIIKLIMTSSRFDFGSTLVRPQKPWTSPFYGSMNGQGFKTMHGINQHKYYVKTHNLTRMNRTQQQTGHKQELEHRHTQSQVLGTPKKSFFQTPAVSIVVIKLASGGLVIDDSLVPREGGWDIFLIRCF